MPPLEYKQGILPHLEVQKPIPIVWLMITGIVNGELSVLVARRKGSTKLTFPGGKIEPGENDEYAIVREVKEETGLIFEVDDILCPLPPYDYEKPATRNFCTQGKEYVVDPWMVMVNEIENQIIQNKQPDKNDD